MGRRSRWETRPWPTFRSSRLVGPVLGVPCWFNRGSGDGRGCDPWGSRPLWPCAFPSVWLAAFSGDPRAQRSRRPTPRGEHWGPGRNLRATWSLRLSDLRRRRANRGTHSPSCGRFGSRPSGSLPKGSRWKICERSPGSARWRPSHAGFIVRTRAHWRRSLPTAPAAGSIVSPRLKFCASSGGGGKRGWSDPVLMDRRTTRLASMGFHGLCSTPRRWSS